mmetsp:Transcript_8054/g.25747  ORF Transcript_8054/g.25747 Transcript_8054/m.25747 type:complete len:100 (-) Transcript_8054:137-436(-)
MAINDNKEFGILCWTTVALVGTPFVNKGIEATPLHHMRCLTFFPQQFCRSLNTIYINRTRTNTILIHLTMKQGVEKSGGGIRGWEPLYDHHGFVPMRAV